MHSLHDLPAPAKLTLFLHVTGRRPDGYHLLQSAFALIDWCDTLHIERRAGGRLSREDLVAPLPADDLTLRAARALQAATGCTQGAHIAIEKCIPTQAGMGGGSSDAATALLALNRLWQLGLDGAALAHIGLQLGADVPFFLFGRHACGDGVGARLQAPNLAPTRPVVGEKLQAIHLPPTRFVVLKPPAGLDTAQIFRSPELRRNTKPAIVRAFAASPLAFGKNDLQPVAERLNPQVTQGIQLLQSAGLNARMTGSGSAVFAPLHQERQSGPITPPQGWLMKECSSLAAHPLAGWAAGTISG